MIKALPSRGGCKTHTRRLIDPQLEGDCLEILERAYDFEADDNGFIWGLVDGDQGFEEISIKPKYMIGDILTIRGTNIKIEITNTHVERVKDITEDGAFAEGISGGDWLGDPVGRFFEIIDSIYGEGTSARNPWVWVYEFKEV